MQIRILSVFTFLGDYRIELVNPFCGRNGHHQQRPQKFRVKGLLPLLYSDRMQTRSCWTENKRPPPTQPREKRVCESASCKYLSHTSVLFVMPRERIHGETNMLSKLYLPHVHRLPVKIYLHLTVAFFRPRKFTGEII